MSALVAWTRIDVRRRWRAVIVLALLVALPGGVVLGALAGARRTDTTITRLRHSINQADVMVLPNQPGFDWDRVRRLPTVQTLGTFVLARGAEPQGVGWSFDDIAGFPAGDRTQNIAVDRPKLISGRYADPNRADEIMVTPGFVAKYGRTLSMRLPGAAQEAKLRKGEELPDGTVLNGSIVKLHVVGTGVDTFDLGPGGGPVFQPTYGFFRDYIKPYFPYIANARVRLRGGPAAIGTFTRQLAQVTGTPDIEVQDQTASLKLLQHAATFTAQGWLLFGIAALLAMLVLVGQAFVRFSAAAADDLRILAALGLDARQSRLAAAAGPALAVAVGAIGALGVAIGLSPLFPTGLPGSYEPDPGLAVNIALLALGFVALLALGLAGAWWSGRHAVSTRGEPQERRSAIATAASRIGASVSVVLGTRFALEPGRGRTRVPVRPALIGAVAGVLGVVGALTFRTGLNSTVDNRERFGQTMLGFGFVSEGAPPPGFDRALQQVAHDPDLTVFNDTRIDVFSINGRPTPTFSMHPIVGEVPIIARSGHAPTSPDEISIGPLTASTLHVHVGSSVVVDGKTLRVSGITYVPVDSHNGYTDGAWLPYPTFNALQPDPAKDKFHEIRFNVKPGISYPAAIKRLPPDIAPGGVGTADQFIPIDEQVILRSVRVQPLLLGGFLTLLALAAVGHGLATAVRRRSRDVAVLRALGMTRRQTRLIVVVQATVLALFGLALGIPIGIAVGRSSWEWLADAMPVVYVAPLAATAIYLAVPSAIAVANFLAAWPARRAARLRVAEVLRAE